MDCLRDWELATLLHTGPRRCRPLTAVFVHGEESLGEHGLEQLDDVKRIASGYPEDPTGEASSPGRGAHVPHFPNHSPELVLRQGPDTDHAGVRFRAQHSTEASGRGVT